MDGQGKREEYEGIPNIQEGDSPAQQGQQWITHAMILK
jgi:hypothetical protein